MVTVVLKGTSFRASIMMHYSINWRAQAITSRLASHLPGISVALGIRDRTPTGGIEYGLLRLRR
jgi:hypothetical protein